MRRIWMALVAVLAVTLVPTALSNDAPQVSVRETASGYVADSVDWTVFEVDAEPGNISEGWITVTKEEPSDTVFFWTAILDEDWNTRSGAWAFHDWQGESPVVRYRDPTGETHRFSGPNPEKVATPTYPLTHRRGWQVEMGENPRYVALLTSEDNVTINVSADSGTIGNHTEGRDGVTFHRVRDWDRVRLHTKASDAGPGLTLDAREQVRVEDWMMAGLRLTPGQGEAGWTGPGGRGGHCWELMDLGCEDKYHETFVSGPSGVYAFVVDRHVQTVSDLHKEPWVLVGDVERPE